MDLIFKRFRLVFLVFAALIFNAHMIIQHDHHAADYDICQDKDSNNRHHSNFPVHCHAFNDLATEKAVNFVINSVQTTDLLPGCQTDINIPENIISKNEIPDVSKIPGNPCLSDHSLLRAPPAFPSL